MILGIDWDDTITEYPEGFKKLVECATEVHIITLNSSITESYAKDLLNYYNHLTIHVMPNETFDTSLKDYGIGLWKANKCVELGIELMFDDYHPVIHNCLALGIPAIQVEAR